MNRLSFFLFGGVLTALALASLAPAAIEADWSMPDAVAAEAAIDAWLTTTDADEPARTAAIEAFQTALRAAPDDIAGSVALGIGAVAPQAAQLAAVCGSETPPEVSEIALLTVSADPFVAANLKLLAARRLVQARMFDEAAMLLEGLRPDDVLDPAALLFCQGVVRQRLLDREGGLAAAQRLLQRRDEIPRRYAVIAEMITADLKQLEDESLDHISRRMQDISRRLDLGRAGETVREIEDGVVESLDKLIKEAEDQLQQMQQQAAGGSQQGGQNLRPGKPASESTPMGGRGPGEVDDRPIGDASGWGDLDPRRRDEVLQQIGREYPAHYREVIEQYFRRLAQSQEENDAP